MNFFPQAGINRPPRGSRRGEPNKASSGMSRDDDFERLALQHLDAAFTLAYWLLRSEADAEDAVQDAMLRAFRSFDTFSGAAFKPWLLAIVRNCAYRALARRRRSANVISLDHAIEHGGAGSLDVRDEAPTPEQHLLRGDDKELIEKALAALSESFREVLVLREIEELSYKEIASIVGVPTGTVMSRLARARRDLAAFLKSETAKDEAHGL